MQAAAGTRGARGYSADELDLDFELIGEYNETAKARLPANRQDQGIFINYAGFNLRDQLRADDTSTPLQFRYAAADCRLYFTIENVYNMTALWHDVARAAFQDSSLCVEGSTGYTTTSGTASPKAPPKPSAVAAPAPGIAVTFSGDHDPLSSDGLPDIYRPRAKCVETQACEVHKGFYTCPKGGVCRAMNYVCNGKWGPEYVCVPLCGTVNTPTCEKSRCMGWTMSTIEQESDRHEGLFIPEQDKRYLGYCRPPREVSAVCDTLGRPRPSADPLLEPQISYQYGNPAASEAGALAGLRKRNCARKA